MSGRQAPDDRGDVYRDLRKLVSSLGSYLHFGFRYYGADFYRGTSASDTRIMLEPFNSIMYYIFMISKLRGAVIDVMSNARAVCLFLLSGESSSLAC